VLRRQEIVDRIEHRAEHFAIALAHLRIGKQVFLDDLAEEQILRNALVAAQSVLIPMQCEYYALEGLSALVSTIDQIKAAVNPELELEGILRTMFDPRNNLANEVSSQLIQVFGDKVFRTIVPRNVRLAEAPSFGKPVLQHDKDSCGALAYLALAGEMLRKDDESIGEGEPPPSLEAAPGDAAEVERPLS
jgi:cellulose biosynthesis protein BcsQ